MGGIRPDMFYGLPGMGMSLPQWLVDPITDDEMAMRYPGTGGDPVSATPMPPLDAITPQDMATLQANSPTRQSIRGLPAINPNWTARLFGGTDPLAQGMYSADQANGAGRQALLAAGLNILQNSGPSPYRRSGLEIAAGGIQAGQQAYQQGVQSVAQRLQQAREMALKERAIATQEAYARQRGGPERGIVVKVPGPNGTVLQQLVAPTTGQKIGEPFAAPPDTPDPLAQERIALRRQGMTDTAAQRWKTRFYDPQRKAIEAYHLFASHLAEAAAGNPEATGSLISAFAANADPFNQLRLGMLQYLSDINPSAAGRARIILQKAQSGTLPPEDIRNLNAIVQSNFREIYSRYRANYENAVKANSDLRDALMDVSPEVAFGMEGQAQESTGRTPTSGNRFMTRP